MCGAPGAVTDDAGAAFTSIALLPASAGLGGLTRLDDLEDGLLLLLPPASAKQSHPNAAGQTDQWRQGSYNRVRATYPRP